MTSLIVIKPPYVTYDGTKINFIKMVNSDT